ncbi:hypothetical protein D3C80_556250 [compost metagenome]
MLMGDECIAHHADAVRVGGGNGCRQQARLTNPLQACGVAIAIEHMAAGKARLMARRAFAGLDDTDTGAYRLAIVVLVQGGVANPHTRHIGNGVVRTRPTKAQRDTEIACSHLVSRSKFLEGRAQLAIRAVQQHGGKQNAKNDENVPG